MIKQIMVRGALSILSVAGLTLFLGCETVHERPGLTKVDHAYEQFVPAAPDAVYAAAQETLQEFKLTTIESDEASPIRRLVARNEQDTHVIVTVEEAHPKGTGTRYTVEVDPGYGEGLSTAVIRRINEKLGVSRMAPQVSG